jgi:hypothetical protein
MYPILTHPPMHDEQDWGILVGVSRDLEIHDNTEPVSDFRPSSQSKQNLTHECYGRRRNTKEDQGSLPPGDEESEKAATG